MKGICIFYLVTNSFYVFDELDMHVEWFNKLHNLSEFASFPFLKASLFTTEGLHSEGARRYPEETTTNALYHRLYSPLI